MKLTKFIIFLFAIGIVLSVDAQCPNDNTFLMDATPPPNIGISTTTVSCINGGQYVTVNVVAGNTYTFSTCGNTAFDTQITVLNSVGAAFIAYNDDGCGLQSTITWVATFTGSVLVLVDQYNCSNTGLCTDLVITCTPPTQNGTGCNTNTTICTAGVAGPFGFSTPGPPVSSCLNFFGPSYAYIVLYITQSGPLQMLINGDANTGYLDVAIFDVPPGMDPCVASLSTTNEIACNYAAVASGCNQIGTAFPCPSSIPSPIVTAGDVLFIVVENWSGSSSTFTMQLGASPAAQTGPPDATIVPAGPFCNTDAPVQLSAVDNGGTWSGPGVSASGVFDPAAVGPGTYTLDYSIGSSPCSDADQTTIVVTNCTCLITTFSATVGSCEAATNTFTVTGDFTYQDNPGAGNLIVEVTNGSGTYTQTFSPPFTDGQLYNFSIAGVPSDGTPLTVTIYFANDLACTAQITSVSPASCACNVDIGTFTVSTTGTQTGNDFVLCFGDDLDITANGDYTPASEATNPPGPVYSPGISWLIYACPPTIALTPNPVTTVPDDPCLLGIVSNFDLNETNDLFWMNAYPPGTFTNNTVYFVPITMYSLTNAPAIYSYVNTTMPCYETGNIYSVQYIPEITEVSAEDCAAGTVTTTVSGGEPSINGSVFTGTNLIPATASFSPGTAVNGGNIVVTGLMDGDVYSYDIVDASGCPITITGIFVGVEDAAFTYPQTAYCQDNANPSPTITGDPGGTFSSGAGLSINPSTGLINLAASTAGTYTITYQTPDPVCFATATFDLTINPLPIVDANDQTICAGGSVTLNGTGADTYTWNNGVVDGVSFSPASTTTYTVTGTVTATGCTNTGTATVTVSPLDNPSFTTANYCQGSASPVPVVTGLAGGTFAFNPTPVPAGPTINATTGVITGGVGGATYTIQYTTNGACPQSSTQTINVNALPVVVAQDVSICIGGTATITATGALTYFWNNGLGAGQTHNVTPATNTVYTVTGTDANGCVNSDLMTVNVLSSAPINAGADVTICLGNATTLTASGGATYSWAAPISAAGASQTVSPVVTTTYTVNGTDVNGCVGTDQVVVTVNPLPTATITGTVTVCQNNAVPTITFTGANGTAPYTFTYNINGGANQTITSTGATATVTAPTGTVGSFAYNLISVSENSAMGCSQTQVGTATITVSPLPTASIAGTVTVCQNNAAPTITFMGANGTAPYTFTYNINGGANQTVTSTGASATVTAPTGTVGTFNYNLVSVSESSVGGCSQLQSGLATVIVNPLPTATIAGTMLVCEGGVSPAITFTGANGTAPYTFTYNINGGATQTVTSVGSTATVNAPTGVVGTFNYNLVSVSESSGVGCAQSQVGTATITVSPNPTPTINGATEYCAGTTATLSTSIPYTTYAWSTGSTNPTVNVTAANNPITVTVTNSQGCSGTSAVFTVTENNVVVYNTTIEICEGSTATIHGNVESVSGMYSQTFILGTGCDSTSNVNLIVHASPIIDPGVDQVLCASTPVTLNATGAPTIAWDNGVINGVPFTQAVGTISYTATGTDGFGCVGTGVVNVTVNPLPTATISGTVAVCQNDAGPTITFTGANGVAPYTFTYNINGGANQTVTSIGTSVTVTAPTGVVGTFDYNLVSVSEGSALGCSQTQVGTATVTVNVLPTATIAGTVTVCQNDADPTITFTGANGTAPYTFTYNINGGANQTVTSVGSTATVTAPTGAIGTFDYNLVSVSESSATGCSQAQSGTVTITITDLPTATIAGTVTVCQNDVEPTITFTGSNGIAPYTFTYTINGGANQTVVSVGATATINAPTGTVGVFDYNLVGVESAVGCAQAQVDQATITVIANPTATISGTTSVCLGDAEPTITLTGANGTAPYTFTYNVNGTGNLTITSVGDIATFAVPTVVAGVFNFNLVSVSDASANGCSQTQVGTATVTVHDLPNVFAGNDLIICEGEQVVLTGSGASGFVWDQGGIDGVPFTPLATNTYTVTGTDANGCVNTDEVLVEIETAPVVSFIGDVLSGCSPLTVTFTNTTPGTLDNCIWILENGTILNGCGSVSTTFTTPGTYDVTLTTTSVNGCIGTATYTDYIYVEADPIASFIPSETSVSNINPEVYFENTSTGAVNYDWDFGDGSPDVHIESPVYQFPDNEPGTYNVQLIAYSPLGCTDTAYATISVREEVIFYVPNTFTPDDDDYNPTFQPVFNSGYDPMDFTMLIFNRWGEIVFETHNADIGWNGTYGVGGEIAQDGTYTWKIEFKTTTSDERRVEIGHVNMMR